MGRADVVLIPKTSHKDQAMVIEVQGEQGCLRLTGPGRSRFTTDRTKGLCHSGQGTRACQEGIANLLSLLWQGRGHEASGSDVLAYPWAGDPGTSRELVEKTLPSSYNFSLTLRPFYP